MPDTKLGRQLDILVFCLCLFLIYEGSVVFSQPTPITLTFALACAFAARTLLHGPLYSRIRRFHNKYGFVLLAGIIAIALAMLARGLKSLL